MDENKFFLSKIKKKKKPKYKSLNVKNWGMNIDKNEYQEIVLSNSNHPEKL